MNSHRPPARPGWRRGFTLIELLVAIVFGALVVESVFRLVVSQQRYYSQQRELVDLRSNLRTAASLLATELHGPAAQDLYSIGTNSLALRSTIWSALICAHDSVAGASTARYVLWRDSGTFAATSEDSALVFSAGAEPLVDDAWRVLPVSAVQAAGNPPPACAWGNGATGTHTIELAGDTAGVVVGSPVRAFRRTQYGLYQEGGRWWLGRKVGSSSTWEGLTGPFASPADSGLVFRYFDETGVVTTTPGDVATVEIILNGETEQPMWRDKAGEARRIHSETLRTRVALRG